VPCASHARTWRTTPPADDVGDRDSVNECDDNDGARDDSLLASRVSISKDSRRGTGRQPKQLCETRNGQEFGEVVPIERLFVLSEKAFLSTEKKPFQLFHINQETP
jgi:hypothetical protein